jgi:hypothetical protein
MLRIVAGCIYVEYNIMMFASIGTGTGTTTFGRQVGLHFLESVKLNITTVLRYITSSYCIIIYFSKHSFKSETRATVATLLTYYIIDIPETFIHFPNTYS